MPRFDFLDDIASSVSYRGMMADAFLGPIDWSSPPSRCDSAVGSVLSSSVVGDVWGSVEPGDWINRTAAARSRRSLRALLQGLQAAITLPRRLAFGPGQPPEQTSECRLSGIDLPNNSEEDAFLSIAAAFGAFPQVKAIYVQRLRSEIQVFTVLAVDIYDEDLMSKLLDLEWSVRQRYREIFFDFIYPVGSEGGTRDFVHPAARCIYRR